MIIEQLKQNKIKNTQQDKNEFYALIVEKNIGYLLSSSGELSKVCSNNIEYILRNYNILTVNAPYVFKRLGYPLKQRYYNIYDLLELYCFVHPVQSVLPVIGGLCKVLGLDAPQDTDDELQACFLIQEKLLENFKNLPIDDYNRAIQIAGYMEQNGWGWAEFLAPQKGDLRVQRNALYDFKHLPIWQEKKQKEVEHFKPIFPEEAVNLLEKSIGRYGEKRSSQQDYTRFISSVFNHSDTPYIMAEAGTGIGKTAGYLAPAICWSRKNNGTLYISTFTKNLQKQLENELNRFMSEEEKSKDVVVRKGRDNYACLLNVQVMAQRTGVNPHHAQFLGLVTRWISHTQNGDITGGDFSGWLLELFPGESLIPFTDSKNECIHQQCPHFLRCFIEKQSRESKAAKIIIANHALIMTHAAAEALFENFVDNEEKIPPYYIFDEGHNLFDVADNVFSYSLSPDSLYEFRRWFSRPDESLIGGTSFYARFLPLTKEIADKKFNQLINDQLERIIEHLDEFPAQDWLLHINENDPRNKSEKFFSYLLENKKEFHKGFYGTEFSFDNLDEIIIEYAIDFAKNLKRLDLGIATFFEHIKDYFTEDPDELTFAVKSQFKAQMKGLYRRFMRDITGWKLILSHLLPRDDELNTKGKYFLWGEINPYHQNYLNISLHLNMLFPMDAFQKTVLENAKATIITSATLRSQDKTEQGWIEAARRLGLDANKMDKAYFMSPYHYETHAKIFIATDVYNDNPDSLADAFLYLMLAAQGGTLGIFTAIKRLKDTYKRIAPLLAEQQINLYAQHEDPMDLATLIELFKANESSCLLGTDAVRDGIDVAGNSLRLVIAEKTPWARPTLLHKERRKYNGGMEYDEMLACFKLKQAFGRLIRSNTDKGIFVLLDSRFPQHMEKAFPENISIQRLKFKDIAVEIKKFF